MQTLPGQIAAPPTRDGPPSSNSSRRVGHRAGPLRSADSVLRTGLSVLLCGGLLLAPSVLTVLRYAATHLNADGVEQSVMSIQHVSLFFWGQDRLVMVISWLASPIADPTANLWVCLTLEAVCFYGLLLWISFRVAARLSPGVAKAGVVYYLALVAAANALLTPVMLQSFALEGQPYALSWLLVGISYQAWDRGGLLLRSLAAGAVFLSLGVNPSVFLLVAFLAVANLVRRPERRRLVIWLSYLAMTAVFFVVWGRLQQRYGGYPTPAHTPAPDYLGFSLQQFQTGFASAISTTLSQVRPTTAVALSLFSLLSLVVMGSANRATLVTYGAFYGGFTLLFLSLFAGNQWVMLNGYAFRYFFPLTLLLLLVVAVPLAAAALEVPALLSQRSAERAQPPGVWRIARGWSGLATGLVALVAAAAALFGPVSAPQDADVLTASQPTATYMRQHDIGFVSGPYWNMSPLLLGLLDQGRQAVHVAAMKSGGDRSEYRDALALYLRKGHGSTQALCVNSSLRLCKSYLSYWTRAGWKLAPGNLTCPAPPILGPGEAGDPESPTCQVLRMRSRRDG